MKRRLAKQTVAMLGGLEGAARALGTSPRMVRRWMRLGLSADGRGRVTTAMAILIKDAHRRRRSSIVATCVSPPHPPSLTNCQDNG